MKIKIFKILCFICLCFSINFIAYAEVVKSIKITGNKRVSDQTIKIYGGIKANQNYLEADIDKILKNLYSTNFFEDVKVELTNGVLNISLLEYPVINELLILGEESSKYTDRIKEIINLKAKDSFIKSSLSKDVEIIKKLYSSLGFNFVKVDTKVRKIDTNNLDLIFDR